jgi:RNA polymerase sigma-70 factor (ECF subfamily)
MLSLCSTARIPSDRHLRMRAMVDEHVAFVARTLRIAGVPSSDLDDEIQRTFMVAARRLDDVQQGSERGFLFRVANYMASRARRTLARRREVLDGHLPERVESVATPEFLADRREMRELVDDIVDSLDESVRAVFTLFELEGLNMSEVAHALGLPRGTVASRLRRARAQFREHLATVGLVGALPRAPVTRVVAPTPLRRDRKSGLQQALLTAGASVSTSASTHAKTLSALGLVDPDGRH